LVKGKYEFGMIGLGVMGRNLVLNIADHGFAVAGYDKDESKIAALKDAAGERKIFGAPSLTEFVGSLKKPRAIMFLVPAGDPVDSVIKELLPHLDADDVIIDGGNSHFKDTDRRHDELERNPVRFLGTGVSGGERGARFGPSIMPGGSKAAYERVRAIFEKAAAKVNGDTCVTYLGPRSAGHYVKMVHNGIEYALMQLISETYDLMKTGLGLDDDRLHEIYSSWNDGELDSFLIQITSDIFEKPDDKSDQRLIDVILDEAKQKGTGKWTSQDAMDLQVPVPTIDAAVAMRDMSGYKSERTMAERGLSGPASHMNIDKDGFVHDLSNALYFAMIIAYAQGMALLRKASETYGYNLNMENIARIWRGGCIIRSSFLEHIRAAYMKQPDLPNLLLDPGIGKIVVVRQKAARTVASRALNAGIPTPALAASLSYFDAYRRSWLPANLIQAQRDYFGAHTYERMDREGVFHTEWEAN
jgi:6-phosphogluconate dehydrogenase